MAGSCLPSAVSGRPTTAALGEWLSGSDLFRPHVDLTVSLKLKLNLELSYG